MNNFLGHFVISTDSPEIRRLVAETQTAASKLEDSYKTKLCGQECIEYWDIPHMFNNPIAIQLKIWAVHEPNRIKASKLLKLAYKYEKFKK